MRAFPGPAADHYQIESRRARTGAWVAACSWVVVAVLLFSPLPPTAHRVISGAATVTGCLGLAGVCLYRFSQGLGRRQVAWMCWTTAALSAAFVYLWLAVVGSAPSPGRLTPGELATVIAMAFTLVGFGLFTSTIRTGLGLVRMMLDGVVLAASVVLIFQDLLAPHLFSIIDGRVATPVSVLTPVLDIVVATIAALQLVRVGPTERPAMALGCAGFLALAVSDFSSAVSRTEDLFQLGSPVDLGTIAGFSLLALGMAWPVAPAAPGRGEETARSALRGTLVTFGVFVAAIAVHVALLGRDASSRLSIVLMVVVVLAVAARQILLIIDNERLRLSLEQRVQERNIELREVTQRTDLLVDSVGDGIYGVDADGLVTFVNPAAAQVLGYRPRDLLGRSAHDVFHSCEAGSAAGQADSDHRPEDCYIRTVIGSGTAVAAVADTYCAQDGRRFPVEVTASPLARPVRGAVVVFRDVTQRREVDRLKTEFVSMVSHELKTPLTAIRGSLGLLAGGALGSLAPPAHRMVEIAMDSSERLTRMINQILDLEQIESGVVPISLGEYRASDLVADALEQVEGLSGQHHIRVAPVTVEGAVLADRDQVVQTLINLIGNAIKFSPPEGEVEVGAAMTGPEVEFWVSDQGRGIPADQLERVFVRFHQVDSSDAREKGGSGLGLAISRSLIERLGGRIWAENRPTGGATFRFTLPATRTATAPAAANGSAARRSLAR